MHDVAIAGISVQVSVTEIVARHGDRKRFISYNFASGFVGPVELSGQPLFKLYWDTSPVLCCLNLS